MTTGWRVLVVVLIFFGLQSVVLFALWWFRAAHVSNRVLFALLSAAVWYGIFRMLVGWYNVFHIDQPNVKPVPDGLSVAVFTTSAPGEPYEMFVRSLDALRNVAYPH